MKYCKNCGKELKEGEICTCKEKSSTSKKSESKKVVKKEETKFCKNCGKKIGVNETCDCSNQTTTVQSDDIVSTVKETFINGLELVKKPVTKMEELTRKDNKYSYIAIVVYSLVSSLLMAIVLNNMLGDFYDIGKNFPKMFGYIVAYIVFFAIGILGSCKLFKEEMDFNKSLNITSSLSVAVVLGSLIALVNILFKEQMILMFALVVVSISITVGLVLALKEIVKVNKDKLLYITIVATLIFTACVYILGKIVK